MDMVFASFIRKASDVVDIRKEMGEKGTHIKIVSKVCMCVCMYVCVCMCVCVYVFTCVCIVCGTFRGVVACAVLSCGSCSHHDSLVFFDLTVSVTPHEWTPSNLATLGTCQSVLIRRVVSFQG